MDLVTVRRGHHACLWLLVQLRLMRIRASVRLTVCHCTCLASLAIISMIDAHHFDSPGLLMHAPFGYAEAGLAVTMTKYSCLLGAADSCLLYT